MKKLFFTLLSISAFTSAITAQVGIGTNTPNASSVLELSSINKAFIPPRMTTQQRDQISGPVAGMMIFNTTVTCVEIYRGSSWFNVCTGTSSTPAPSSNDVASVNLIAHWTFDDTYAERISGVAGAATGTVTKNASGGQIGGYASFNDAFLLYDPITNINKPNALAAGFTFTSWAKFPTTNNLASLWQINSNIGGGIWGTAAYTFRHGANDSLDLDGTITHVNGSGTHPSFGDLFAEGSVGNFKTSPSAWAFVAMVYDTTGGSKKIKYYANGVLKATKTIPLTVIPANEQFELITTASFGGTGRQNVTFGTFNYVPVPFPSSGGTIDVWQTPRLTGAAIDDTRLFNKALSQSEITDLYTRGLAGN
ncbi:MAG: hypothetical protein V4556_10865 [Bacteroidota bacterium]